MEPEPPGGGAGPSTGTGEAPAAAEPLSQTAPPLRPPVLMNQDWRDLTFVHWAVRPDEVAAFMPPGVRPDTFEGRTYVGLVPFRMVDAGVARGPGVPWVGTFLETNVRLYSVDATGRRGIVFLSLDANRAVVVAGARAAFGLPYRFATMSHHAAGDVHEYAATLRWPRVRARSYLRLKVGAERRPGPLDVFLSARWGLHTRPWRSTWYVPNQHEPWPLRDAVVEELDDGLVRSVGLGDLATRPPDHVAFSSGVHTEFGLPHDASRPRATR